MLESVALRTKTTCVVQCSGVLTVIVCGVRRDAVGVAWALRRAPRP